MRTANIVMACVFAVFTLLQFNDPDRWVWLALYAYAALASVSAAQQSFPILAPIGLPMYLILAVSVYPGGEEGWIESEAKREVLGMLLCALWMGVNSVGWLRSRTAAG